MANNKGNYRPLYRTIESRGQEILIQHKHDNTTRFVHTRTIWQIHIQLHSVFSPQLPYSHLPIFQSYTLHHHGFLIFVRTTRLSQAISFTESWDPQHSKQSPRDTYPIHHSRPYPLLTLADRNGNTHRAPLLARKT